MTRSLAALATPAAVVLGTTATWVAQSARKVHGPMPCGAIENESTARLIVEPPLPDPLARGVVQIQYRVENLRTAPVFGAALDVSPRVGHLHISVDGLPCHWADASDINTVEVVGLPPGPLKVPVERVDAAHQILAAQTVTFILPRREP